MLQQQQQQLPYRWPRNTYRPQHGGLRNSDRRQYRRYFYNDRQALAQTKERSKSVFETLMGWLEMLIGYLCCSSSSDIPLGTLLTANIAAWMLVPLQVKSLLNTALLAGLLIQIPLVAVHVAHKTECSRVVSSCRAATSSLTTTSGDTILANTTIVSTLTSATTVTTLTNATTDTILTSTVTVTTLASATTVTTLASTAIETTLTTTTTSTTTTTTSTTTTTTSTTTTTTSTTATTTSTTTTTTSTTTTTTSTTTTTTSTTTTTTSTTTSTTVENTTILAIILTPAA